MLVDTPPETERQLIKQHIQAFNDSRSTHHRTLRQSGKDPIAVWLRDTRGNLIGGMLGATYWSWLSIDELWIAEPKRHQGHGSTLVKIAEQEALRRGCARAHVRTWDFQACGFYERLGYRVVGELTDYPPGQVFYWLHKEL